MIKERIGKRYTELRKSKKEKSNNMSKYLGKLVTWISSWYNEEWSWAFLVLAYLLMLKALSE